MEAVKLARGLSWASRDTHQPGVAPGRDAGYTGGWKTTRRMNPHSIQTRIGSGVPLDLECALPRGPVPRCHVAFHDQIKRRLFFGGQLPARAFEAEGRGGKDEAEVSRRKGTRHRVLRSSRRLEPMRWGASWFAKESRVRTGVI
jgi:hypothetical protein